MKTVLQVKLNILHFLNLMFFFFFSFCYYHLSVLNTGEATPWVLYSVLGPSLQERHGHPGACPEKDSEAQAL